MIVNLFIEIPSMEDLCRLESKIQDCGYALYNATDFSEFCLQDITLEDIERIFEGK